MAESNTSGHLRTILIGVTTTVLGTAAVYYLGFRPRSGGSSAEDILFAKEATTKAWKSYVTFDNIYFKNQLSILDEFQRSKQLGKYRNDMLDEMHKYQDDLDELLKNKNIDVSFVSMINRRIRTEKEVEPEFKRYIDNIQSILDSNHGQQEKSEELKNEDAKWLNYSKGIVDRALTEVEELSKTLSEKYGQPFDLNEFKSYQFVKQMRNKTNTNTNVNTNNTDDNNQNINQNNNNNNNRNNGRWTNADENNFIADCVRTASQRATEARAREYCTCMLGKIEKVYASYDEANRKLTQADMQPMVKQCDGQQQQ
jgi:hypothetical protein